MTMVKRDNGIILSSYNQTTALDMFLKFPLGAPIFIGPSAIIENSVARYNLGVSNHLECRAFVSQKDGVVTMKEKPPVNRKFRRRLQITGLKDATVCFFAEKYCEKDIFIGTETEMNLDPIEFNGFKVVTDEHGTYYKAEHLTGDFVFSMPFPEYVK